MTTDRTPPRWFRIAAILLVLWELAGCLAWVQQIRLGAAAMGPVDDWSRRYYAALPAWYNGVYAVATFGSLLGGACLLLRKRLALACYKVSFAAILAMFGYAFAATDLIAHKGLGQALPFPLVIAGIGAASIWLARVARDRGWLQG